jgi:hypothetical protein
LSLTKRKSVTSVVYGAMKNLALAAVVAMKMMSLLLPVAADRPAIVPQWMAIALPAPQQIVVQRPLPVVVPQLLAAALPATMATMTINKVESV